MARSVFFSFHYQDDISRVMTVRNRWLTYGGQLASGIIDHAEFEKIQRQGKQSIERWINQQMKGTSATVVLIGAETLKRPYVQYEIRESLKRNCPVIGVYINLIKDLRGNTSMACNIHTAIGKYGNGEIAYFDDIASGIYNYVLDDGYNNLDRWVENAINNQ